MGTYATYKIWEVLEEIGARRWRGDDPVEEVDDEDHAEKGVHHRQHGIDRLILRGIQEHEIDDRQDRKDTDEDLVSDALQFTAFLGHVRILARAATPSARTG